MTKRVLFIWKCVVIVLARLMSIWSACAQLQATLASKCQFSLLVAERFSD